MTQTPKTPAGHVVLANADSDSYRSLRRRPLPRAERLKLGKALRQDRLIEPHEQCHPRSQRFGKVEFAAHRAFGDCGDLRLDPGIVCELVDALLPDHR